MQQSWKTVRMVKDEKDVMRFMIDQQEVDFTLDAFRKMLQLPLASAQNPFIRPAEYMTIKKFLKILGYKGEAPMLPSFLLRVLLSHGKHCSGFSIDAQPQEFNRYPRYVKLIINYVFRTYPNVPKRVNEPYHYIRDDDLILNMFTNCVVAPMIQLQLGVSTQETHRTLSVPRSPKPKRTPQKKNENVVGESSKPRKSNKMKLTTTRPDPIIPLPTYSEIEQEQLTEAKHVSIAIDVNAKEAKARENDVAVEKAIMSEEVEKLVDGGEEETKSESYNTYLLNQEDLGTGIKPQELQGESRETGNVVDDDEIDDDQHNVDALIKIKRKDSLKIRDEKKQTPIPTPPRYSMTNLSLDKEHTIELTKTNVHVSNVPSNYMKTHVITLQPPSATIQDQQQQLYIKMRDDLQSQTADPDNWKVLKEKFEKSSILSESNRCDVFRKRTHDDHPDDAPPEEEKNGKKQNTSGKSKFVKD
ncbi:hypothetical protein Tco_0224128 [Tanacetum coccineum]